MLFILFIFYKFLTQQINCQENDLNNVTFTLKIGFIHVGVPKVFDYEDKTFNTAVSIIIHLIEPLSNGGRL